MNINDVHKIIDKKDVFDILKKVTHVFNISIIEDSFFSDIIDLAGYDLWFDDWTDICNLIGKEEIKEKIIDADLSDLFDKIEKLNLTPVDNFKKIIKLINNTKKPTRENLLKEFTKHRATFDRNIKELKDNHIIDTNKNDEYFFVK